MPRIAVRPKPEADIEEEPEQEAEFESEPESETEFETEEPESESESFVEESEEFNPPFSANGLEPLPSEGLDPLPDEVPLPIDELRETNDFRRAEDAQKEKTMTLKEKLFSRKKAAAEQSEGAGEGAPARRGGGFFLTFLTLLLLVAAGMIWWELHKLTDALGTGGLSMLSGKSANTAVQEPKVYDYAIDFLIDKDIADGMKRRGQDGWEVVGSRRTQDGKTNQYGYEFIFMRPRPSNNK